MHPTAVAETVVGGDGDAIARRESKLTWAHHRRGATLKAEGVTKKTGLCAGDARLAGDTGPMQPEIW